MKYILMVFAGACSFGLLSTFVKLAYHDGFTAAEITLSQSFTSMAVLWLLTAFSGNRQPIRQLLRQPTGWLLLSTGVAIGLTTYVYYLSVQYITASLAVVLLMQFTWMGTLLEWFCFGKKPGAMQLLIIALILAGTWLASGITLPVTGSFSIKGILLALLSALLYAIYITGNSRISHHLPLIQKSAFILTGYTLGIALAGAGQLNAGHLFNPAILKWILFFCTFGTMIPQLLFVKSIPKVGAGVSAIIMTAELPVAVITAHILLHERVTPWQWTGVVIMLLAIAAMYGIQLVIPPKKS